MSDTINGKTPEEIKAWLGERARFVFETVKKWAALEYIQQLESRLAESEKKLKALTDEISYDCRFCKHISKKPTEPICDACVAKLDKKSMRVVKSNWELMDLVVKEDADAQV